MLLGKFLANIRDRISQPSCLCILDRSCQVYICPLVASYRKSRLWYNVTIMALNLDSRLYLHRNSTPSSMVQLQEMQVPEQDYHMNSSLP